MMRGQQAQGLLVAYSERPGSSTSLGVRASCSGGLFCICKEALLCVGCGRWEISRILGPHHPRNLSVTEYPHLWDQMNIATRTGCNTQGAVNVLVNVQSNHTNAKEIFIDSANGFFLEVWNLEDARTCFVKNPNSALWLPELDLGSRQCSQTSDCVCPLQLLLWFCAKCTKWRGQRDSASGYLFEYMVEEGNNWDSMNPRVDCFFARTTSRQAPKACWLMGKTQQGHCARSSVVNMMLVSNETFCHRESRLKLRSYLGRSSCYCESQVDKGADKREYNKKSMIFLLVFQ